MSPCIVDTRNRNEDLRSGYRLGKTTVFTGTCNAPFPTVGLFLSLPSLPFFSFFPPFFPSFLRLQSQWADRSIESPENSRYCSRKRKPRTVVSSCFIPIDLTMLVRSFGTIIVSYALYHTIICRFFGNLCKVQRSYTQKVYTILTSARNCSYFHSFKYI